MDGARHQADDFEGHFALQLPIRGSLKHGQYSQPIAKFEGDWTVLKRSSENLWPNAVVDTKTGEFVLATYPVDHPVNEVDIVRDADFGMFFIVDTIQYDAYNWISQNRYENTTFEDFNILEDLNTDTPVLISENPESDYGRAVALWKPPTQALADVLHRTPFDFPKTLLEGANLVGRRLQLNRGDIPSRLSPNKTVDSRGNPEKAKELHEKFFEN